MTSWDTDSECDDEPLNLNLFVRKSFGFEGFPDDKQNKLKSVVQGLGAVCDDLPKYVFTTSEYFLSLNDNASPLYNVTYIRDCIDANRCLSIDQYRFGPKYSEKKDFRDFDPCCHNFHDGEAACIVCDPSFKAEEMPLVEEDEVKDSTTAHADVGCNSLKKKKTNQCTVNERSNAWEPWEHRLLLDYIVGNNLFEYCKSPSLYRRMVAEGFLKHRSAESMRVQFRTKILKKIDSFNLPKPVLQKFKKIRSMKVSTSYELQKLLGKTRFRDLAVCEK